VSALVVALVPPAKVNDVKTNSSAERGLKRPAVIHVKTFSISKSATNSGNAAGKAPPHLLGVLRGGEENIAIGQRREQQHEDTLTRLPGLLQQALIRDLGKSVAPADSGNGAQAPRDSWAVTAEFLEIDAGNRACRPVLVLGRGKG
jgi:uncharacterized protein DUF4410